MSRLKVRGETDACSREFNGYSRMAKKYICVFDWINCEWWLLMLYGVNLGIWGIRLSWLQSVKIGGGYDGYYPNFAVD